MRVTVKVRGQETPLRDGAARSTTRMMEGWWILSMWVRTKASQQQIIKCCSFKRGVYSEKGERNPPAPTIKVTRRCDVKSQPDPSGRIKIQFNMKNKKGFFCFCFLLVWVKVFQLVKMIWFHERDGNKAIAYVFLTRRGRCLPNERIKVLFIFSCSYHGNYCFSLFQSSTSFGYNLVRYFTLSINIFSLQVSLTSLRWFYLIDVNEMTESAVSWHHESWRH